MKRTAAILTLLIAGMITEAQYDPPYGGPPMWSRRPPGLPPSSGGALSDLSAESQAAADAAIYRDNYLEFKTKIEKDLGLIVKIRKGGGLTAMLPTDGIPDHLKDHTIIVRTMRSEEDDT
jgi:hypothetical protein